MLFFADIWNEIFLVKNVAIKNKIQPSEGKRELIKNRKLIMCVIAALRGRLLSVVYKVERFVSIILNEDYYYYFLKPTSTKPQAWKLRESIMAATVAHSAIIVFWKETAFPCWRAMVRRWWQEQQVCSSTGELTNYTLVSVGSLQQSYYLAKIICLTWMSGQVSVSPALDVTSLSQYHA